MMIALANQLCWWTGFSVLALSALYGASRILWLLVSKLIHDAGLWRDFMKVAARMRGERPAQ